MKNLSLPEQWNSTEIKSDFYTYISVLSNVNKNAGISIINGDYSDAIITIQSLIDSCEILKNSLYYDVDDIMASYYWLNGMVIACGWESSMRIDVADANFQLAYEIADPSLRTNISQIRDVVKQSSSAYDCNDTLGFFEDEDNYLKLLYSQQYKLEALLE